MKFLSLSQQDAQEFLRFFIEGVHDDLNSVKRKPVYSSIPDDSFLRYCSKLCISLTLCFNYMCFKYFFICNIMKYICEFYELKMSL